MSLKKEIGSNMQICGTLRGDKKNLKLSAAPTKPESMKEANAECDAVFNALTDADLVKPLNLGRAGKGPAFKFQVIDRFILQHSQELYGYMAVYLRLKRVVPPSSEANEP